MQDKKEKAGFLGEMKFQKITEIRFLNTKEKKWVVVEFENETKWLPDLIDLGLIISFIGKCEDEKYPHGKGRILTKNFLNDCFGKNWYQIKRIYKEKYDPNNKKEL